MTTGEKIAKMERIKDRIQHIYSACYVGIKLLPEHGHIPRRELRRAIRAAKHMTRLREIQERIFDERRKA